MGRYMRYPYRYRGLRGPESGLPTRESRIRIPTCERSGRYKRSLWSPYMRFLALTLNLHKQLVMCVKETSRPTAEADIAGET